MYDYTVGLTNTNGVVFPNTEAINATGPSTTDGTEFVKIFIDQEWGARQAIMDYAGLTPDGVTEAAGTAQIIEALQKGFGAPPGVVSEWALAADPAVSGHRAILLQGQGIIRASYPDLDDAVYVGDANNAAVAAAGGAYYRADDAGGVTPNIVGIYLILPETRGVVPRGLDLAASIDPLGAARYLGDLQGDTFQGHRFYSGSNMASTGTGVYGIDSTEVPGASIAKITVTAGASATQNLTSLPKTDGVNGTPRTGPETRMYNRSTTYVIWY